MLRLIAFGALCALAACKEDAAATCSKLAAYEAVQNKVLDRLKSPGSAQFPPDPTGPLYSSGDVIIATKGDCHFAISSHVDSQNGFGALLRTRFSADAKYDETGKRWSVSGLVLAPS